MIKNMKAKVGYLGTDLEKLTLILDEGNSACFEKKDGVVAPFDLSVREIECLALGVSMAAEIAVGAAKDVAYGGEPTSEQIGKFCEEVMCLAYTGDAIMDVSPTGLEGLGEVFKVAQNIARKERRWDS